jgi:hypothetical protein
MGEGEGVVTKERAVELVEALLARERLESPWAAQSPEVAAHDVKEHALGWLVFWQSVDYLRSGDPGEMLVGHGPYLVDREDGGIHHIPVTVYGFDGWEEQYLEQVRGARPPDPLVEAVRELLRSGGTIAAMRHLRGKVPSLGLTQAKTYVMAVRDDGEPPEELAERTRPERKWLLDIETLAEPTG